jgi:hypothetical protein
MQNTKIVADRDIIEQDEPATSMGWTPTDLHRCQGLSALPVGTPWHPILPESYSLCQRTPQKYSTEMSSRQLAQDIIFLVRRRTRERCHASHVHFVACTFDLNILQGLSKYPRHDVRKPHHLHDDLQRETGTEQRCQFFSTCRIQKTALQSSDYFRGIQEQFLLFVNKLYCGQTRALSFDSPFHSLIFSFVVLIH